MISTKGRYSIRVLLDLAEHRSGDFIPMKEVAARQDISLKYIERLMPALKAAGLSVPQAARFMDALPLSSFNMSWLLFFAAGFLLGLLWEKVSKMAEDGVAKE